MSTLDRLFAVTLTALIVLIGAVLAVGDRVGAPIEAVFPTEGSHPPVTASVDIDFGAAMDRASVEASLQVEPVIDYEVSWEGRRLIVDFDTVLEAGQNYNVRLGEGAQSEAGRSMRPIAWSFTPRDARIVYLAPASEEIRSLWLTSTNGDPPPREIFAPENGILDFSMATDGSQVAATVPRDDGGYEIWLVDVDSGRARNLLDCAPASCSSPAFSPDGRQIAYEYREQDEAGEFGAGRIYLLDAATGGSAPVYADESLVGFGPAWSPDGGRLAFIDSARTAIRVVDLATHDAVLMPSQMGQVGAFAPDGSQMIYSELVLVGGQFVTQLFYVDLDGDQGVVPLFDDAEEDRGAAWSPLGRWLLFGRRQIDRSEGFGFQLMALDLETGEITALIGDPTYNNLEFHWDPTGRYVAFSRFELGAEGASPGLWLYDSADASIVPLVEDALDGQWLP